MRPFQCTAPATVDEVVATLVAQPQARLLAGGTDLLPRLRRGLESPACLVSLSGVRELSAALPAGEGLSLGAGLRLSAVAARPEVAAAYPLLVQAIAATATPQVRHRATLGGSLCQRPRCWYFRHPDFCCARRGGVGCPALQGQSRYHALFPSGGCAVVHPSDTATVLTALDACVEIAAPQGRRLVPLSAFFVDPAHDPTHEHRAGPCELITRVVLPAPAPGVRALFLKASERRAVDFALASVAALVELRDGCVARARLVLGGVAARPHPLPQVEEALRGQPLSAAAIQQACAAAVEGAQPPRPAAYKAGLVRGLLARALRELAAG